MFPSRKDWTISLHFCVTGLTGRPNFTPLAFATLNPASVLFNQRALEFRHRYQDVHDQPSCGVLLARVDRLGSADERDAVGVEFEDHLRQMGEAAAKPIKLHAQDNVNLPLAHSRHEPIKASPRKLPAGNRIAIFGGYAPTLTLAVVLQFEALRVGALVVGRDAIVKGDTFAHASYTQMWLQFVRKTATFRTSIFSCRLLTQVIVTHHVQQNDVLGKLSPFFEHIFVPKG